MFKSRWTMHLDQWMELFLEWTRLLVEAEASNKIPANQPSLRQLQQLQLMRMEDSTTIALKRSSHSLTDNSSNNSLLEVVATLQTMEIAKETTNTLNKTLPSTSQSSTISTKSSASPSSPKTKAKTKETSSQPPQPNPHRPPPHQQQRFNLYEPEESYSYEEDLPGVQGRPGAPINLPPGFGQRPPNYQN